uniref:uncharacterized protein LOC122584966 n=1 Tax=Erigeron canadensis TaxID=72917 RepID=UPI001CB8F0A2|nr:uncharacterized protein LOC122584966 [Erigeron canadensis]
MSIEISDGSNGPVTNVEFSLFKDLPAIKNWDDRFVTIVGTFRGIILLAVKDYIAWENGNSYMQEHMILYNPFTGVHEVFKDPYFPLPGGAHAYGFGHGATPNDLKLIRFRMFTRSKKSWDSCEVLNLKTRSWSRPELISPDGYLYDDIGIFLKGYLYWMNSSRILALDVEKMVISFIGQPNSAFDKQSYLGTCHGCLWLITNTDAKTLNFDVWVMGEQGVGD